MVVNSFTKSSLIEKANDFLKTQLESIKSLEQIFNENFVEIIELLGNSKGKIIITGVGKTSYIAKKIAASLSSTGSKSYYIHPTEASHGDLGIIDQNDIIIILSKSGQSHELFDLIDYCKNNNNIIIAITSKTESKLGRNANYLLLLQNFREISFINAPTSSTSMMLVLGDIIAICLSEKRNFDEDDYRKFHPGGQIGRDLLRVKDLMHINSEIPIANYNMKMGEILVLMTSKKFGCAVITDDQNLLIGIITDGDLRRSLNDDLLNKTGLEVMNKNPIYISQFTLVNEALKLMNQSNVTCLIIADNRKVQGIIHIHDCLDRQAGS